jgi:hypothetical protein
MHELLSNHDADWTTTRKTYALAENYALNGKSDAAITEIIGLKFR